MRFVKIDHRYYNLDLVEYIAVLPVSKLVPVLEVRLWSGDDYLTLAGDDAQRFLDALDKMEGVYVA